MSINSTFKKAVIALTASILIAYFISVNVVIIIISSIAMWRLLSNATKPVIDSHILHLVITFVLYFVALQMTIMSAWLLNHEFPLSDCLLLTAGWLIPAWLVGEYHRNKSDEQNKVVKKYSFATRDDIVSITVSVLLLAVIIIPPMRHTDNLFHNFFPKMTIGFMDMGVDDTNHYGMLLDHIQFDRGVLYKTAAAPYVNSSQVVSSYPPAWHSANALLATAFKPTISASGATIAYVITKLVWFFILTYLFARFSFMILHRIKRNIPSGVAYIFSTALTLFFSYYVVLEQFKEGFYSFIPELIYILVLCIFFMQLAEDLMHKNKESSRYRTLFPILLAITGGILSWFLILPALCLAIFIPIVLDLRHKTHRHIFLHELFRHWYAYFIAAISVTLQVILLTRSSSRSFREGINDPGSLTLHSSGYYIIVGVGIVLFLTLIAKKYAHQFEIVLTFLGSLLAFCLFIYLYQYLTAGTSGYYFLKTLNTVMIIAVPISTVGITLALATLKDRLSNLSIVSLYAIAFIAIVFIIGIEPLNTSNVQYALGHRTFNSTQNEFIFNQIAALGHVKPQDRHNTVLFYEPGITGFSVIGSSILKNISVIGSCYETVAPTLYSSQPTDLFVAIAATCMHTPGDVIIVTTQQNKLAFEKYVNQYGLARKVVVASIPL